MASNGDGGNSYITTGAQTSVPSTMNSEADDDQPRQSINGEGESLVPIFMQGNGGTDSVAGHR